MRGGNEEDAKHDTCEVTQVKHIVRFAWCWEEFLDYGFVNVHRGLDKNLLKETYVGKFLKVASKAKKLLNYYRFLDKLLLQGCLHYPAKLVSLSKGSNSASWPFKNRGSSAG